MRMWPSRPAPRRDDEIQRELDAIFREEKDKMDRLDEIKILRIISESEYRALREIAPGAFRAEMGAGAIRGLVSRVDLDALGEPAAGRDPELVRDVAEAQACDQATARGRSLPQVGQQAGMDDHEGPPGDPTRSATDGAARWWPFRDLRLQRSVSSCDQP